MDSRSSDKPLSAEGHALMGAAFSPEHEAPLLNYMRITRQPVGYLINFGPVGKLEWKRFVLSEFLKTAD